MRAVKITKTLHQHLIGDCVVLPAKCVSYVVRNFHNVAKVLLFSHTRKTFCELFSNFKQKIRFKRILPRKYTFILFWNFVRLKRAYLRFYTKRANR